MNATTFFLKSLSRQHLIVAWKKNFKKHPGLEMSTKEIFEGLLKKFKSDLCGFLNSCNRAALDEMAKKAKGLSGGDLKLKGASPLDLDVSVGGLRLALWEWATVYEQTDGVLSQSMSIRKPTLLRGKLVFLLKGSGLDTVAPSGGLTALDCDSEPEDLEELLRRAEHLKGMIIPTQGRDKGGYGAWIAASLGLVERGLAEPDWQGEVEVKTLPVAKDGLGRFYVSEDPAIAMENVDPLLKLKRVLWITRSVNEESSQILGWYYQVWDWDVARLVKRDLHQRPKGGKGATTKGWYLHKRFFIDSGLLRSLENQRRGQRK